MAIIAGHSGKHVASPSIKGRLSTAKEIPVYRKNFIKNIRLSRRADELASELLKQCAGAFSNLSHHQDASIVGLENCRTIA